MEKPLLIYLPPPPQPTREELKPYLAVGRALLLTG